MKQLKQKKKLKCYVVKELKTRYNITYHVLKFRLSVTRWSGTPFIRSSKILILAYHNNPIHF